MDCADCERLRVERQFRRRIYEMASLKLTSAETSSDAGRYMMLKKVADEARLDLDLVDAEMTQHQGTHAAAVPFASPSAILFRR